MDIKSYNSKAWDQEVTTGNPWTVPVSPEMIAKAKQGEWSIVLTNVKPIPKLWLGDVRGKHILCLASGGGQQAPVLAAVGARVTTLDASKKQLERDQEVAERENLEIRTVEGDMRDLSAFKNETFDLIVHPVSNCFAEKIRPVWKEAFRVLKPGGGLLSGFINPVVYCFDPKAKKVEDLYVKYSVPYSDLTSLTEADRRQYLDKGEPLEFGHTLEDQIGGQIDAGFYLAGFYEDKWTDRISDNYFSSFIATRAIKPSL